jgi:DNA-binding NarL/FixJ family response regulator
MEMSPPATKVRLLLIEDNRLLRDGLAAMINEQPDLEVVAALGNASTMLQHVRELTPQVVLLDLALADQDSLSVVDALRSQYPSIKLIVMGLLPREADLMEFIGAGVSGFLLKEATFSECLNAIRFVANGENVLPSSLTGSLFSAIVEHAVRREQALVSSAARMTKREREIIELISEGLSNKEIAQRLNLATFTVKSHVHNILEKLALHTRLQVASYYAQDKSGPPSGDEGDPSLSRRRRKPQSGQ